MALKLDILHRNNYVAACFINRFRWNKVCGCNMDPRGADWRDGRPQVAMHR